MNEIFISGQGAKSRDESAGGVRAGATAHALQWQVRAGKAAAPTAEQPPACLTAAFRVLPEGRRGPNPASPQPAEEGRAGGCSAAIPQDCPGHGGTRPSAAGRGGGEGANNGSRGRGPAAPRPRGGSSAATDPAASGRLPPPLTDNAGRGTGTSTARPLGS